MEGFVYAALQLPQLAFPRSLTLIELFLGRNQKRHHPCGGLPAAISHYVNQE